MGKTLLLRQRISGGYRHPVPDIVGAVAIIGSHIKQIRWQRCAVPVAAGLILGVCPGVAEQVGEAMPWPLRQSDLQAIVVAEVLIGDPTDVGKIRELREVRAVQVLASCAAGRGGSSDLSRRVRGIARRAG